MNKDFREGAETVAEVAKESLEELRRKVENNRQAVIDAAKDQHKWNEDLIKAFREIAFGISSINNARDEMSNEEKILLISMLREIKETSVSASKLACKYFDCFCAILGVEILPRIDLDKLSYLGGKTSEYVLYVLIEYKSLFTIPIVGAATCRPCLRVFG